MFKYNREHKILYSWGRGSMDIGIYQFDMGLPNCLKFFSNCQSVQPTQSFGLLPNEHVNVRRHEINRGVRLVNDKTL